MRSQPRVVSYQGTYVTIVFWGKLNSFYFSVYKSLDGVSSDFLSMVFTNEVLSTTC